MNNSLDNIILSICIPTWNRAKYLKSCLNAILEQIKDVDVSELELFVSDNNSEDETPEVVQGFIQKGLPITYNKYENNLGAAGNFLKCMQFASGKYILLLGDDDILAPDAINFVLDLLRGKDYGLIHVSSSSRSSEHSMIIYDDNDDFIQTVSYWFTFVSGNIFQRKVVPQISSPERYSKTHLLQMPFYIKSALSSSQNVIIYKEILKISLDGASNGGYNFYEVFIDGYLSIWSEFLHRHEISQEVYDSLKRDLYERMIYNYNISLLIQGKGIKNCHKKEGWRGGLMVDNAWKILFHNYWNKFYFWRSFVRMAIVGVKSMALRILKK